MCACVCARACVCLPAAMCVYVSDEERMGVLGRRRGERESSDVCLCVCGECGREEYARERCMQSGVVCWW